ncbi:acyl-CoA dehydrogenase family protein, partial [Micromonospora tulbaghiae]
GTAAHVPWAAAARTLLVYAGDEAFAVPAGHPGLRVTPGHNLAAEPRDDVTFDVPVTDGMRLTGAAPAGTVRAEAALLTAAALTGALETAVEHTRRHVTTREQFGRPLLAFQAVGQTLARMTSHTLLAGTALDAALAGPDPLRVAAARVLTGRAATLVARGAHQLHGAMGVTREHPLHLSTRRLWSWRDENGTQQFWARTLGAALVPRGSAGVWSWLTDEETDS